jgi:Fe-S cluster assembly protein SufD
LSLAAALRTRDAGQLPGKRDEDWRWTDLRGLIRAVPDPSARGEIKTPGPFDGLASDPVVIVNGGSAQITVPAGADRVAVLRVAAQGSGSHATEIVVEVVSGGRLVLLESHEGDAGGYLAHTTLDVRLGEGASLERIVLARDGAEGVNVVQASIALSARSVFAQTLLTSGARRQRLETHVAHPGGHAEARLDGVYLLADKRHADLTSVVTHQGLDGVTNQLAKGVVRDQARGVFQGRIVVEPGADRTDARMGHHALILSDRAEVDAKPELLIHADDVACAHGNTVGALDEDALFYARQRGLSEDQAKALLTEAFVGEVVDRIGHEGARAVVRAWVAERLRGSV